MAGDSGRFAHLLVERAPYLRALVDGALTKRALADARDVSRSTVDRAVRDLETVGAVERRDGAVVLTLVGRLALGAHDAFHVDVGALKNAAALSALSADTAITLDVLRGADVVDAEHETPHRPVTALTALVEEATRIELYATRVLPSVTAALSRRVADGLVLDVYLDPDALDALVADFPDEVDTLTAENVRLAEVERTYPFGLGLFDLRDGRRVMVLTYGERGVSLLLVNDTRAAIAWARDRLDAVAASARRLS